MIFKEFMLKPDDIFAPMLTNKAEYFKHKREL